MDQMGECKRQNCHMEQHQTNGAQEIFLIKAVYDILSTPVNLHCWGLVRSDLCKACGKTASLKHSHRMQVCSKNLHMETHWNPGDYCRCYKKVVLRLPIKLWLITDYNKTIYFIKENSSKFLRKRRHNSSLFEGCTDWYVLIWNINSHFQLK